jgi:tRNA (guanine-N7-)-methyltransferase
MPTNDNPTLRNIRSFVLRDGRLTKGQSKAIQALYEKYALNLTNKSDVIELNQAFGNNHPTILEVGFGNGESLMNNALDFPDINFIGIEVFKSGVGQLLSNIEKSQVDNVQIIMEDAVSIISSYLDDQSLHGIQILFPDPWPKKKHHKRRLINQSFLALIHKKLQTDGRLYLATDHQGYADWIDEIMISSTLFKKINLQTQDNEPYYSRSSTKFERRGLELGHAIREWYLQKI